MVAGGGGSRDELRRLRFAELKSASPEEVGRQIELMHEDRELPNVDYHFRRHKGEFGAETLAEYVQLFRRHLEREDLRYFSFIRPVDEQRMWYLVAEDTGDVAQYNGSRQRQWTFFRPRNFAAFMNLGGERWVEVRRTESGWQPMDELTLRTQ